MSETNGTAVAEKKPRYSFSMQFQKDVLALMARDPGFLLEMSDALNAKYFEGPSARVIAGILLEHAAQYKTRPAKSSMMLKLDKYFAARKTAEETQQEVLDLVHALYKRPLPPDLQFVREQVADFGRLQALKSAIGEYIETLNSYPTDYKKHLQIVPTITRALGVGLGQRIGVQLFDAPDEPSRFRGADGDPQHKVPIMLPTFNLARRGGLGAGELGVVLGESNKGKCHARGQLILLADGSRHRVEKIQVGDHLCGPSGVRTVLSTNRGRGMLYDVRPVKGESWRVNGDHLLTLIGTGRRKSAQRMIEVSVAAWMRWTDDRKRKWKLPRSTGVEFVGSESLPVPVDPYFLGVLLGDGSVGGGQANIVVTTMDEEIEDCLAVEAACWGLRLHPIGARGKAKSYGLHGHTRGPGANVLITALRSIGVYGMRCDTKRIPRIYRTGTVKTRRAVLAGLLDADGSLHDRCCYDFISKSPELAGDVVFIARSLGLAAYLTPCEKRCQTGGGGTYYRVSISGDTQQIPCRIPRKKAQKRVRGRRVTVTGFSIVPVGVDEYFGFTLDGDGRYLLGDFTITHNSMMLVNIAAHAAKMGRRAIILTTELKEYDMIVRLLACLTKRTQEEVEDEHPDFKSAATALKLTGNGKTRYLRVASLRRSSPVTVVRSQITRIVANDAVDPEIIVIDSADDLSPSRTDFHKGDTASEHGYYAYGDIYSELTNLASDYHCPIWTASQVNRMAYGKEEFGMEGVGDSLKKVQIADAVLCLCQTAAEEKHGNSMHVFVDKLRRGRAKFSIPVKTDFARCIFRERGPTNEQQESSNGKDTSKE